MPVQDRLMYYICCTHARVDHSGMLPLLYARGFRGSILETEHTTAVCSIMLRDCANIQAQEAERKNRKAKRSSREALSEPIYTMEDADGTIKRFIPCHYGEEIKICEGIKARFTDVGHLLGSSSIEIWLTEEECTKKIVFSGDLGN